MAANEEVINLLDQLKFGTIVHVPSSAFPDYLAPSEGYWVGKTCKTKQGGTGDIGVHIPGEEIFTHPRTTVIKWLPPEQPAKKPKLPESNETVQ